MINLTDKELIDKLNYYTELYDKGTPAISDKEWDDLYFELVKREKETGIILPNSPTQKIHYEIKNKLTKVIHNHFMSSADKTKDWDTFLNYFTKIDPGKDVIGMPKLDGLTLSLWYKEGKLFRAETRGNGKEGEDVTHNASVIPSIPNRIDYKEELIVDGEIICKKDDFEPFSKEYKNPRNFASGSIRLLNSKECASRNLTFVVWYVVKGFNELNSLIDKFRKCTELNFTVVPWTSSFDWDAKDFLINQAKELGYPIDGLIGRFDDIAFGKTLGSTSHHRKDLYAFKMYDEVYSTKLLNIDYTMSRNGTLTPVAVFEPIELDDSIINRASLHNLSIMEEILGEKPYIGQPIEVIKSNMIIPQVIKAEKWEDK